MPVYEEKLVSPFALRFTQEHIRTTFRDGRQIEQSIAQIETRPGDGQEYDLILRAPFPHIEIVRWNGKRHNSLLDGSESNDGTGDVSGNKPDDHWFTFDNRRLYCLQRVAASHWPKRVAAVVEVLYTADRSTFWRKYDTTTGGQDVNIRRSSFEAPILKWSWRQAAEQDAGKVTISHLFANKAILRDDLKSSLDDLMDAPLDTSTPQQTASHGYPNAPTPDPALAAPQPVVIAPKASATAPATQSAPAAKSTAPSVSPLSFGILKDILKGAWQGPNNEMYEFEAQEDETWMCTRQGQYAQAKFTITYDAESELVWWGNKGTLFLNPAELREQPNKLAWFAAGDMKKSPEKRKPRFEWQRNGAEISEALGTMAASDGADAVVQRKMAQHAAAQHMQNWDFSWGYGQYYQQAWWCGSEARTQRQRKQWVVRAGC